MSTGQAADIAIRARNVTLTLGSNEAPTEILKGIDLDVARGSSVAILGPSGSGKSSLMAILSGLERASGGSVSVAGVAYDTLDEDEAEALLKASSSSSSSSSGGVEPAASSSSTADDETGWGQRNSPANIAARREREEKEAAEKMDLD